MPHAAASARGGDAVTFQVLAGLLAEVRGCGQSAGVGEVVTTWVWMKRAGQAPLNRLDQMRHRCGQGMAGLRSLAAASWPATGRPAGSSRPSWTRTVA